MASNNPADWIDSLWPAVCARTLRPVAGVLLEKNQAAEAAVEAFEEFLEQFREPPAAWETVLHWLATRAAPKALVMVAELRRNEKNPNLARDPQRLGWERNPDFAALRQRTNQGALTSREWSVVDPILWRRSAPILARMGIGDDDARDVYMETLAELVQARNDSGPLEKMLIFEELPRFFATMVERRAISWQRKQSARKRQPVNPALQERLDDADNPLSFTLADPKSITGNDPWGHLSFDRIYKACKNTLTDLEWHLVTTLFVEGTQTRLELAGDPWVLEHLGIGGAASESKRRRRLNLFIEEALSKLGRRLETVDL